MRFRLAVYVCLMLVIASGLVFAVYRYKTGPVYGWRAIARDRVALDPGAVRVYNVQDGGRLRVQVRAASAVQVGIGELGAVDDRATVAGKVPVHELPCSWGDALEASIECGAARSQAVLVQDVRAGTSAVLSMQGPTIAHQAARSGPANDVWVTISTWQCVENCPVQTAEIGSEIR